MEIERIDIIGQNGNEGEHYQNSPTATDLVDLLDYASAISLTTTYGGMNITIPKKISPNNAMAMTLGPETAQKLAEQYGGNQINIPSKTSMIREMRNKEICRLYKNRSISEIAVAVGLSRRMVRKIVIADLDRKHKSKQ